MPRRRRAGSYPQGAPGFEETNTSGGDGLKPPGAGFDPLDILSEGGSKAGGGVNVVNINTAIAQAISESGPGDASGGITNGGGSHHHHSGGAHHHHR